MTLRGSPANGLPECSGWIEKFSLGRGIFSTRKWCRRYAVVTRAGIGYMHHEPSSAHGDPSKARCFIPFEGTRRRTGEVPLRPVFLLCHVNSLMHREAPAMDCCVLSSCTSGDTCSMMLDSKHSDGFYFALSFEDSGIRRLLLLRTETIEDYLRWTSVLTLYVPTGSRNTLVPVAHPLLMQRYADRALMKQLKDMLFVRRGLQGHASDTNASMYVRDPDPCSPRELSKLRRRVLAWDEGERQRLNEWCGGVVTSNEISAGQVRNEKDLLYLTAQLDSVCDKEVAELFEEVE